MFLLDGLYEDLNCVKNKSYVIERDAEGRSDEDVVNEFWEVYMVCNNFCIVDIF